MAGTFNRGRRMVAAGRWACRALVGLALLVPLAARAELTILLHAGSSRGLRWVKLNKLPAALNEATFWKDAGARVRPEAAKNAEQVKATLTKWVGDKPERSFFDWDSAILATLDDKVTQKVMTAPAAQRVALDDVSIDGRDYRRGTSDPWALVAQVRDAVAAVVEAKRPHATWLAQLKSADVTQIVRITDAAGVRLASQGKTLSGETPTHFTDTWSGKPPQERDPGKPNTRVIYLDETDLREKTIAHEFVHWLAHPAWGEFERRALLYEQEPEACVRELKAEWGNASFKGPLPRAVLGGLFEGDANELKGLR